MTVYDGTCVYYRLDNPEAKAWDLNGDGKLSKKEADAWYLKGNGNPIIVDNSKINWSGLQIPKGKNNNDGFSINTTTAFWDLPHETASTYGGTSFRVIDAKKGIVEVQRQGYHYEFRNSNTIENRLRNFLTAFGKPGVAYVPGNTYGGHPYMIFYSNPTINTKK